MTAGATARSRRSHQTMSGVCSPRGSFPPARRMATRRRRSSSTASCSSSTPGNQVIAIDAKTGTLLWRYRRPLPTPVVLLHPTSRGVAVYGRQGVLRGRRSGARRAGRENRRGSMDDACRRQRERVLHVARAARGRRQGADRHVWRRARYPRLRRGVRCRDRQGALEDLHDSSAWRARQ